MPTNEDSALRAILIGGTSHVGKSSAADALADRLGWDHVATDYLKRHPGRPWKKEGRPVPLHVQEHYLTLPVDKLIADVLRHYRSLWPRIEALITARITDLSMDGMVMEGSALWPETVAPFEEDGVAAVWLTAADGLIQQRMHASSRYGEATPYERTLIDKFLQRTIRYNADMMAAVERLQLPSLEVARSEQPEEVAERILALIDSQWGDG